MWFTPKWWNLYSGWFFTEWWMVHFGSWTEFGTNLAGQLNPARGDVVTMTIPKLAPDKSNTWYCVRIDFEIEYILLNCCSCMNLTHLIVWSTGKKQGSGVNILLGITKAKWSWCLCVAANVYFILGCMNKVVYLWHTPFVCLTVYETSGWHPIE